MVQAGQKPPDPNQLDPFPDQTGLDIERSRFPALLGEMGQQNAAVQAAADQHACPAIRSPLGTNRVHRSWESVERGPGNTGQSLNRLSKADLASGAALPGEAPAVASDGAK